jgi:S1-C subfamily serine protease
MTLELRVLGGARRGVVVRSDRPTVVIGRHPSSDLQLDPEQDLDVSAKHAEIRRVDSRYFVSDAGSTNGTHVNGVAVKTARELRDGDIIALGDDGPTVQLHLPNAPQQSQRRGMIVAGVLLSAGIAIALFAIARGRSAESAAGAQLAGAPASPAVATNGDAAADFRAVARRNGPAIAYLVSVLRGKPFGGTAFSVSSEGLLVTNRHLVEDRGIRAARVLVKFSDTDRWLEATVVATPKDTVDDLALLQIKDPGVYPVIAGVSAGGGPAQGDPVAAIGFPLAEDTPMDTTAYGFVANSSLVSGVVSKLNTRVLQIDSYAGHGSSGSPVFDRDGFVVGVIYGGARESGGRLVYATPSLKLLTLLPSVVRSAITR